MEQLLTRFAQQVNGADAALVYYAGHGVQSNRANYLVPVDAKIEDAVDVRYNTVELNYLLEKLALANTGVNLVFLDACRDNPFAGTRSQTRGLARTTPSGDNETLISYSTSQGRTAADKSPYTPALVSVINQHPTLQIELLLKRVGAEVKRRTQGKQRPDYTSSVTREFCFGGCGSVQAVVVTPPVAQQPDYREPEMRLIRGGTFTMGSPSTEKDREDDEKPHTVRVGDFYLGKTEVTIEEYQRCVTAGACKPPVWDEAGSKYHLQTGAEKSVYQPHTRSVKQPVVGVSLDNAMSYAKWLSGFTGKRYGLPTEAQWEYAARAGTQKAYYWGNQVGKNQANCNGCGSQWDNKSTAPVGRFVANRFGLHDMLGNVFELTCSEYDENYAGGEQRCATFGSRAKRALRGGSWFNGPRDVRSAGRGRNSPTYRYFNVGFRLSRTP